MRKPRAKEQFPRHPWLPSEIRALRTLFPHMQTRDAARILGRSTGATSAMAGKQGLEKSDAFKASVLAGVLVKGHADRGVAYRFPKGHVPANKGLRRPGYGPGRMRETQFKKGHTRNNKFPVGTLRLNADGYVDMKVSEDLGAHAWRAFHRILWEDARGPIPPDHILRFKDGDRFNLDLDNLELLTRREHRLRNSIHHLYPQPLKHTVMVLGALKRRIREKQDRRPA
jgi:hypothetical protein